MAGRRLSVRDKGGYWYSEAGGVGRYFGRVDEVSRHGAMSRLFKALAGGEGVNGDREGEGGEGVGASASGTDGMEAKSGGSGRSRRPLPSIPCHEAKAHAAKPHPHPNPHLLSTPEPSPTVRGLADAFLAWLQRHRHARTHYERSRHLRRWCGAYGDREAIAIAGGHLEAFQAKLQADGHAPDYIRKHEVSVRACFRWGVRHKHLPEGFQPFATAEAIKPPVKALLEGDLPTREEVAAILAHAPPTLADFLRVQYATGARTGELMGARVADYQRQTRQLVIVHHKRERTMREPRPRVITLNAEALAIVSRLAQGRRPDEPLFRSPRGRRWRAKLLGHHYRRARVKAKVRGSITPYSLRHLWISEALMAGVDVMLVARMAGTSINMIEKVYGRFRSQSLSDAQSRLDAMRAALQQKQ